MAARQARFLLIVFLGALSALPPLSLDMGLPGLPAIEATFREAAGRAPLTLSLFLAGFALAPCFCGPLADRFGRRPLLLFGLGVFVAAALASAMAPSFPALLACRLLQGLAAGACAVLPLAIVKDVVDDDQARTRLSQVAAVLGIAPILAPVLGAWIIAVGSWRSVYVAQAAVGLVLLAVAAVRFTETLPAARRRSLDPRSLWESYRMVIADRAFRDFTLIYALEFACIFAFVAGSASVLMQGFGLSSAAFASLFALVTVCALLGSLVSAALAGRHIASTTILAAGLAIMSTCTLGAVGLALTHQASVVTLMPLIAIAVFCFEGTVPSANHEALLGLRDAAGSASGLMRAVQMAAGAASSAAIAGLDRFGRPALAMTAIMALCSTGAAAIFMLHRRTSNLSAGEAIPSAASRPSFAEARQTPLDDPRSGL